MGHLGKLAIASSDCDFSKLHVHGVFDCEKAAAIDLSSCKFYAYCEALGFVQQFDWDSNGHSSELQIWAAGGELLRLGLGLGLDWREGN